MLFPVYSKWDMLPMVVCVRMCVCVGGGDSRIEFSSKSIEYL